VSGAFPKIEEKPYHPVPLKKNMYRRIVIACVIALILLGLAWELWLAPLRPATPTGTLFLGLKLSGLPASWLLSLKVLPLIFALPALVADRVRAFQWWSMAILIYLTEGLVRATSDLGPSRPLAWIEVGLAIIAFLAILAHVKKARSAQAN
jgi:uncharacterized membrane protein